MKASGLYYLCIVYIAHIVQETKGVGGLVTTPSTKNLSKFFTDDAGNDSDGKSFFDSFTVSESDGDRVLPGVAHSVSQDSQPDSITGRLCTLCVHVIQHRNKIFILEKLPVKVYDCYIFGPPQGN